MMPAAWQGVGARFDNLIGYINVMQWWVMCVVWGSWGMWVRIRYMHGGVDALLFFCFRRDHDSGGGCSRGYGSTSIRTTPLSSRRVSPFSASSSTFVAVAAKSSSAP